MFRICLSSSFCLSQRQGLEQKGCSHPRIRGLLLLLPCWMLAASPTVIGPKGKQRQKFRERLGVDAKDKGVPVYSSRSKTEPVSACVPQSKVTSGCRHTAKSEWLTGLRWWAFPLYWRHRKVFTSGMLSILIHRKMTWESWWHLGTGGGGIWAREQLHPGQTTADHLGNVGMRPSASAVEAQNRCQTLFVR